MREVDGRHRAAPVHEPRQIRESMRVVDGVEVPLARIPQRATPSEDAAAQQHAVIGLTRLARRDDIGVVRVERVEYRVRSSRLVE